MNIIKYLLCKNSGMSNGESFLRASTNMPISGGAVRVIEKTVPFADIITVTDALARPAVDLQSEITATQNLNGYEYPWVGGAGKNKLNVADVSGSTSNYYIDIPTNFVLTEGVTYTFSADITTNVEPFNVTVGCGSTSFQRDIKSYDTSSTATSGRLSITFTPTATQLEGRPNMYIRAPRYGRSETFTYSVKNMQLELGSTETAYAPYENICPISGRTEVNVTRTGKNLATVNNPELTVDARQDVAVLNQTGTYTYTVSFTLTNATVQNTGAALLNFIADGANNYKTSNVIYRTTDNTPLGSLTQSITGRFYTTFTDLVNPEKLQLMFMSASWGVWTGTMSDLQVELGSATAYEPYEGDTFNTELGRTVYGGTLDLTTGELKITHAYVDLGDFYWMKTTFPNVYSIEIDTKKPGQTNFITTSYRTVAKGYADLANGEATSISLMLLEHLSTQIGIKDERATTAAEFKTLVTGQKMVYELATPQTISLTPTEVMMLENNNTIWADSGRVQLTYYAPKE